MHEWWYVRTYESTIWSLIQSLSDHSWKAWTESEPELELWARAWLILGLTNLELELDWCWVWTWAWAWAWLILSLSLSLVALDPTKYLKPRPLNLEPWTLKKPESSVILSSTEPRPVRSRLLLLRALWGSCSQTFLKSWLACVCSLVLTHSPLVANYGFWPPCFLHTRLTAILTQECERKSKSQSKLSRGHDHHLSLRMSQMMPSMMMIVMFSLRTIHFYS
jgi:hypothetical protein